MCFMAEMDCLYSYILKQLTAIEPVKSSSLYFEFVLTTLYTSNVQGYPQRMSLYLTTLNYEIDFGQLTKIQSLIDLLYDSA